MKFRIITRIVLSMLAISGGFLIVIISLFATNPVLSAAGSESKEFYLGQTILPDHVIYPTLMIADRVKLENVSGDDEVRTRVVYSFRRLEATQQLLVKNKQTLAYTTLTKSQKYLLQAGRVVIDTKLSNEMVEYVQKALVSHVQSLEVVRASFEPQYYAQINDLIEENKAMIASLEEYKNQ